MTKGKLNAIAAFLHARIQVRIGPSVRMAHIQSLTNRRGGFVDRGAGKGRKCRNVIRLTQFEARGCCASILKHSRSTRGSRMRRDIRPPPPSVPVTATGATGGLGSAGRRPVTAADLPLLGCGYCHRSASGRVPTGLRSAAIQPIRRRELYVAPAGNQREPLTRSSLECRRLLLDPLLLDKQPGCNLTTSVRIKAHLGFYKYRPSDNMARRIGRPCGTVPRSPVMALVTYKLL